MLKGVEDRYNHTETLEVAFAQTSMAHGRKLTENGELYLRKPGRTRWEYKIPAGKLFGSDGKYAYAYFPDEKRFEKMSLKESDDMKAPLAFLLGRMHFDSEFKDFRTEPDGPSTFVTCTPKSDKLPYKEVTFLIDPNFTIRWLNVKAQDGSQLDYAFNSEKRNVPIAESMFKFAPPLGVMYTDSSQRPN